jgi:hypothetical protein
LPSSLVPFRPLRPLNLSYLEPGRPQRGAPHKPARGLIRYLRPEFQCPNTLARSASEGSAVQQRLKLPPQPDDESPPTKKGRKAADAETSAAPTAAKPGKLPWPKDRAARTRAIQDALASATTPLTIADLSARFFRARQDQVEDILTALVSLGLAQRHRGGKFTA